MTAERINILLERVRLLTEKRGSKTQLAEFLGVRKQRLNEWLFGSVVPSGEITLALLEWVTAEEEKQKALGSVTSTAKSKKTRKRKRSNVKPNSGPGP